jgi:hypothetical protein
VIVTSIIMVIIITILYDAAKGNQLNSIMPVLPQPI